MNEGQMALMIPILSITMSFLLVGWIVGYVTYFRFRRRREVQETIRAAIEKGQDLPGELLENRSFSGSKPPPRKDQDLRRGVVLIAVGLGIGAFGLLVGDEDAVGPMMGIGSIPLLIGAALTLLWIVRTRHEDQHPG